MPRPPLHHLVLLGFYRVFFCVHWSIVIVLMSLQWLSVDVIHQCKLNELDNGNGVRLKKKTKNKRSTAIINQVESFKVVPQKRFAGFSFCLTFWWQVGQQTTFLVFIFLVKYKKKEKEKKRTGLSVSFLSVVCFLALFIIITFLFVRFSLSLSLSLSASSPVSPHTLFRLPFFWSRFLSSSLVLIPFSISNEMGER